VVAGSEGRSLSSRVAPIGDAGSMCDFDRLAYNCLVVSLRPDALRVVSRHSATHEATLRLESLTGLYSLLRIP
jgi:hypothetical protein